MNFNLMSPRRRGVEQGIIEVSRQLRGPRSKEMYVKSWSDIPIVRGDVGNKNAVSFQRRGKISSRDRERAILVDEEHSISQILNFFDMGRFGINGIHHQLVDEELKAAVRYHTEN